MILSITRPIAPICLANYRHGRDNWSQVTPDHKTQVWQQLNKMQKQRCAYCERSIYNRDTVQPTSNAHIEHFRQKAANRYPQGMFEWGNLFGSCNNEDSCGKHKDKLNEYNHLDLIKMDQEETDDFFHFVSDGTITIPKVIGNAVRRQGSEAP